MDVLPEYCCSRLGSMSVGCCCWLTGNVVTATGAGMMLGVLTDVALPPPPPPLTATEALPLPLPPSQTNTPSYPHRRVCHMAIKHVPQVRHWSINKVIPLHDSYVMPCLLQTYCWLPYWDGLPFAGLPVYRLNKPPRPTQPGPSSVNTRNEYWPPLGSDVSPWP